MANSRIVFTVPLLNICRSLRVVVHYERKRLGEWVISSSSPRGQSTSALIARACQRLPPWFVVVSAAVAQGGYAARGRPRKDAAPRPQGLQIPPTPTRRPVTLDRE